MALKDLLRNLVLCWIKQSWRDILEEMVRKYFKTCGISKAVNSTEDNAIYEKQMPETDAEENQMEEFNTDSEDDEP